mmetsp:Transcript_26915/g.78028  ORF Transcript_26915/g.78028 Transcript_26915/m.78028 type:complete len:243 (-) Transcript_26915:147-875(-)
MHLAQLPEDLSADVNHRLWAELPVGANSRVLFDALEVAVQTFHDQQLSSGWVAHQTGALKEAGTSKASQRKRLGKEVASGNFRRSLRDEVLPPILKVHRCSHLTVAPLPEQIPEHNAAVGGREVAKRVSGEDRDAQAEGAVRNMVGNVPTAPKTAHGAFVIGVVTLHEDAELRRGRAHPQADQRARTQGELRSPSQCAVVSKHDFASNTDAACGVTGGRKGRCLQLHRREDDNRAFLDVLEA